MKSSFKGKIPSRHQNRGWMKTIGVHMGIYAGVFALTSCAVSADTTTETASCLISNGDFEKDGGKNWPAEWSHPEGASWEIEEGNHFLRLKLVKPDQMLTVYRSVDVKPEHKAYALSFRVRYKDMKKGKDQWHDGRIMLDFKDKDDNKLNPSPRSPYFNKGDSDWKDETVEFLVPEGAVKLEILPSLIKVPSGTIDFDDLKLTAVPAEPIIARQKEAEEKRLAEVAKRAAEVKPQVPPPPADKIPPELHVAGNKLQTPDGRDVWLQGLAVASMEWNAAGDNILKTIEVAIKDWKANCIRLGVREHFWIGKGPYQKDGGAAYRQLVEDSANLCAANGVYIVIDLHRFRAPEAKDAEFWKDVAAKFKNNPAVMFELFNEPHDISWEVWRDGGLVTDEKKKDSDALAENKEKLKGFQSVGMQKLVDVVRETGAKNIVMVGGLDWGYDLSGIMNGFALDDRGGNGIVYSSHVYPWKSEWQKCFLDAAVKYPLFIGETGCEVERMPFIPPERHEDPYTWAPDMLGIIQKHKLNWTAWCFHPKSTPRVILDWEYTPTPFWGVFVKEALSGKQFELKKMR
ncbi:MAG TPA: hypothetical protein DET40_12730 [Lentisphaeria bacterium]|nr:hypothetical protein [Lentisphaeria bacterium]